MELSIQFISNLKQISNSITRLKEGTFDDSTKDQLKQTCENILQDVEISGALASEGPNVLLTAYAAILSVFLMEVEFVGEKQLHSINLEHFDTVYLELFKVKYHFDQLISARLG